MRSLVRFALVLMCAGCDSEAGAPSSTASSKPSEEPYICTTPGREPDATPAPSASNLQRAQVARRVERLFAGYTRSCATSPGGELACWGDAVGSPAPPSDNPAFYRQPLQHVTDFALGDFHACAVDGGEVKCWGWNWNGELGGTASETCPNGPMTVECATRAKPVAGLPKVKAVAIGHSHTCAVAEDGSLWCWGASRSGNLGYAPTDKCTEGKCSRTPGRLLGVKDVREVALGSAFSCALVKDGTVWCWGANDQGQLGSLPADEAVHEQPARVAGLDHVVSIDAGTSHACALREGGEVWCWGSNALGELGRPGTTKCGKSADACSEKASLVAKLPRAAKLAISNDSSCALVCEPGEGASCGVTYCWGNDMDQWLGIQGDATCKRDGVGLEMPCQTVPAKIPGLTAFDDLANGGDHACGLGKDDTITCWGAWSDGQLGFRAPKCRRDQPIGCVEPPGAAQLPDGMP